MIKRIFHFLGSVHFAVTLIAMTALFVIGGTLLESKTESHKFAAYYTYRHPAFLVLIALFFINILVSALRRWPFKPRHIPFLITHLGLLMILSGTMVKNISGVQGSLLISEGSGSHTLLLPDTTSLYLEKNGASATIAIQKHLESPFSELTLELLGYFPHSTEKIETWIKGEQGIISGLKPFQVFPWSSELPRSGRVRLTPEPSEPWNLYAFKADDAEAAAREILSKNIPALILIEDKEGDTHFYAFDPEGNVWSETYPKDTLNTIIAYDDGRKGYAAMAKIPFPKEAGITLETPITWKHSSAPPSKKIESNLPMLVLKGKQGEREDRITLRFDRLGTGLKRPFLDGDYLVRFQQQTQQLPYHVRLRQARQINYALSSQPYSYESDLLITDIRNGKIEEQTISMNRVHETWDGYRFYLSNITPSDETAVKKIQLIVNYDPAKYILTYPGGLIVTLGIILLFWFGKKKKEHTSA